MVLKTDFKDEILSDSQPYRIYNIVDSNGSILYNNVRITKAYTPQQEGDEFGAKQINETNKAINEIANIIYPVGSIYMSINNTNPKTLFGGTWTEWGKGRVPVGVDTNDDNFNSVEKTGGKKEQVLRASIGAVGSDTSSIGYAKTEPTPNHNVYQMAIHGTPDTTPRAANHATEVWQDNGKGPTTLQPYITCYMWKRTG